VRLRDAGRTTEQIAYGLGCRDPAYFSRFFSRRVGMSPGAYRKASRVAPTSFAAWPCAAPRRCVAASFARAECARARFFEKAFDTSRRLPYIAARRRRIRVRAEARPRGFRANSSSSLPC